MKTINKPLSYILNTRTSLVELIIVGFFIALGTNLIVSSIIEFDFFKPRKFIIIGFSIVLLSIFYLLYKLLKNRSFSKTIKGSIIYDKENNCLINIPKYKFGSELTRFFKYSFVENKDIKALWEKDKLSNMHKQKFNLSDRNNISSVKLIREATEYYILDKLSAHLTDYFNDKEFESNIISINRDNISDIIIKNRFLDLFSKPMNERSGFLEDNEEPSTNVIMSNKNGHFYNQFGLTLPKNSKVTRDEDSSILIENNRFTLKIKVIFDGFSNNNIPHEYMKYILGMGLMEYNQYSVYVKIDVNFKVLTYISMLGWEYYNWIDSLLDELEYEISSKHFSERIGWERNEILLQYIDENFKQLSIPDTKNPTEQKDHN